MLKRTLCCVLVVLLALPILVHAESVPVVPATAVIRAVGDIMVHKEQLRAHKGKGGYNFTPAFSLIEDSLRASDFMMGNLECTVGKVNGMGYSGYPAFNAPPELLDALRDAGFDMLTLANNHMLDRSVAGVTSTLDELDARQLLHVGASRTQAERDTPVVVDVKGIKIGVLAYTEHTNGNDRYLSAEQLPYVVNLFKDASIAADIKRLKDAGAELIVACAHWGTEYKRKPDASTKSTAQMLSDLGVDVIVGSHPHVAQRIEWIKSADGTRDTLVAYSLGNFVAHMVTRYTDGSLIFEFTVERTADGRVRVSDTRYVPLFLWKGAEKNGGRIVRPVPSGKLWKEPLKKMGTSDRAEMKNSFRALIALIKETPSTHADE